MTGLVPRRLADAVSGPRAWWIAVTAGVALSIPSLFGRYIADDHLLRAAHDGGSVYMQRAPWDLYHLVSTPSEVDSLRERGVVAWWAVDELRVRFCRPLSSLVHAAQLSVLPNAPWLMHGLLITLYALLILVAGLALRRLDLPPLAFGLALFLYAIDDVHAYSVGWIASLNTVLTCLAGAGALWAHLRWRGDEWLAGAVVGPMLFALSLLASEGGLGFLGYLVAYALFLDRASIRGRLAALAPYLAVTVVYLAAWKALGFGTTGSGVYLDVSGDTVNAVLAIAANTPILVLSQVSSLPPVAMILSMLPGGGAAAAAALVLLGWLMAGVLRASPNARFLTAAMVLSTAPFALSGAQDRVLLWPSLAGAALVALIFVHVQASATSRLCRATASVVVFANLWVSLVFFVPMLFYFGIIDNTARKIEAGVPETRTVVVNAPMDVFFMYPAILREERGAPWPDHLYLLYGGVNPITVTRTADATVEIACTKGYFASTMERVARSEAFPFAVGETVDLAGMTAEVAECTADGRPTRVRFTFAEAVEEWTWLCWDKAGPVAWDLPAIGEADTMVAGLF